MGILKPVLVLAILGSALFCSNAWATSPPPRIGSVPDAVSSSAPPVAKPAPPAPKKQPVKRRAVRQMIDGTPTPLAPLGSAPQLAPAPPVSVQVLPSPLIMNNCIGAGCTDANGARYHGGVGTTLLSPQGRMCSNNGITVQCF